jgi:hypothetical protein
MIQLCIDRFKYYDILIEISPLGDLWTLAGSPMNMPFTYALHPGTSQVNAMPRPVL